jgi:transcriptional regulator with XRE-family HTH domain
MDFMTGTDVRTARKTRRWTQASLAKRLDVSQGYVCLLERGARPVPATLATRLARLLGMEPATLPASSDAAPLDGPAASRALAALGYPGFGRGPHRKRNPAEVVLRCLRAADVEARVVEALVWLLVAHPHLDWPWLVRHAKVDDVQNRLGFVVSLAEQAALKTDAEAATPLTAARELLDRSRLVREDAFRASMTGAERRWLRRHRPADAVHWNLLTNLTVAEVAHAG